MELKQGTLLQSGKYIIKRVLGQGGFGITYLAEQVSLKREVAVKEFFMKESCERDAQGRVTVPTTGSKVQVEKYRAKFLKEAETMASLDHPNIVNVIDVFNENGTVYYVMPFMKGGSLSDLVKSKGRLPEERALRYVAQIASALKYMHEQRHLCHFDVKPANILLNAYDNAMLIDFGISKNYDSNGNETSSTPVGKSAGFAPLEQYQEMVNEFSPASDVYALGATLYYLVMGKVPPTAVSLSQGEELIFANHVSQDTQRLIKDAMKLASRQRPQSVDAFMAPASAPSSKKHYADDATRSVNDSTLLKTASSKESSATPKPENNSYPSKKWSENKKIIIALAILPLLTVLLILQPWNRSSTEMTEEFTDSLQVSPVYTAKHAFECLKNGDEDGFKSCLIEFDDELGSQLLDSAEYNDAMMSIDGFYSLILDELQEGHTLEIDDDSYHDFLDRTDQIIQDYSEDFEKNGYIYRLVIFEAHYVRYDGKELTSDLRFIKNTLGQWKMSIPISRPAEEAPAVDEEKAPADSVAD